MKVLVTGGAGFIGSHTVENLVGRGYDVGILDNFSTGRIENIENTLKEKGVALHRCDVCDADSVHRFVGMYDAVVHLAALVSVPRSVENPDRTNSVNVHGTLNLLVSSVRSGIKKFVFASSSSVYGESQILPKKEDMPAVPVSPYGVSKLAAEQYCRVFARIYGLNSVCLRYFNVYGPRQRDGAYSGVIPNFISSMLECKSPMIYGDGNQTRDFTFVNDVANANVLALESNLKAGEVLNIAAGKPVSIKHVFEVLRSILGVSVEPKHMAERSGDIKHSYADISKAKELLGYRPEFDIEEGLRKTTEWFEVSRKWKE